MAPRGAIVTSAPQLMRRIGPRRKPRPRQRIDADLHQRQQGYLSYSNRHADLLFELISRRYEHKSTVVTTNRAFKEHNPISQQSRQIRHD